MTSFPMALRRLPLLLLVLASLISLAAFDAVPDQGIHPLAWMASLLPLQLAALLWALSRQR
ncbi:hypothetical protein [Synechococcus sp. CS-1328]|uniref:hypothetical protein n=1 Tax=Synechococcus sp. CS-1328 TaxID=2847976 RepID=UPI00223B396E|nr:hypothetical protein [Synechococcus sp. CS-1328]MCT0224441.1 hypothetical protein [Synechococcus sp. CS-1328]